MLARAEVGEVEGSVMFRLGGVSCLPLPPPPPSIQHSCLIFTKISLVTLDTDKEWLMEPGATANSDDDTEHISGWSLFFQC